ncbi:unnamed protein product, partial [Mesorhabditis spiculigera]
MVDSILIMGEPIGNLIARGVKQGIPPDSPDVDAIRRLTARLKEREIKMGNIWRPAGFVQTVSMVRDWNSAVLDRLVAIESNFESLFHFPDRMDRKKNDFLWQCRRFDHLATLRIIWRHFVDMCPMPTMALVQRTVDALKALRLVESKLRKPGPDLARFYHDAKTSKAYNR